MNKFEKISKAQFFKDFAEYLEDECLDIRDSEAIYNLIKLPKRATMFSAGYDIFAPYDIEIPPKGTVKLPTGIRVILDDDKFLAIYPRSGLGFKYKMQLYNSVGIVDCDYYGKTITIKQGEAMCQGIIQQFFKTEDDVADGVRFGGFGSTTK